MSLMIPQTIRPSLLAVAAITSLVSPLSAAENPVQPAEWQYRTETPAAGWEKGEGRDSDWKTGPGGFGVRLEDLYYLGESGTESLTPWPYELDPRAWRAA